MEWKILSREINILLLIVKSYFYKNQRLPNVKAAFE